jgi:hypothetical protein
MIRRWFIRGLALSLLTLCVVAWVLSHFQGVGVARFGCRHPQRLELECGTISYYLDTSSNLLPNGADWVWLHWRADPQRMDYLYRIADIRCLGFAYRPTPAWAQSWVVFIPFWCPTVIFSLLVWLGWRKTRPKYSGKAFPVEVPPAKTEASKPRRD